jgi:hypothetical protein
MISLRDFAQSCLGIGGGFSVTRDFFGYRQKRPGDLSLRLQLSLLRNPHIHLDVILVGGDQFTTTQHEEVDCAVFGAREIFEQIPLGIGRITFHQIDVADADGLDIMTKKSEVKTLLRRYRGSNDDALDVFFPREYNADGKAGYGNAPGCVKSTRVVNGCVVSTGPSIGCIVIRRLMAHELGHALRLTHRDSSGNLMESGGFGSNLTGQQQRRMLRDCYVRKPC